MGRIIKNKGLKKEMLSNIPFCPRTTTLRTVRKKLPTSNNFTLKGLLTQLILEKKVVRRGSRYQRPLQVKLF